MAAAESFEDDPGADAGAPGRPVESLGGAAADDGAELEHPAVGFAGFAASGGSPEDLDG